MSTEYRRGIPSTARIEAATRLGLLWEDDDASSMKARWRLEVHADAIRGDYATSSTNYSDWDPGPLIRAPDRHLAYRPIRPDGTPVDWEVLDQEVARVGQQGQPVTVTPTASAAPTTQPQGFRAVFEHCLRQYFPDVHLRNLTAIDRVAVYSQDWQWGWGTAYSSVSTQVIDLVLARWTVYQELKPLYDLVDGAQGEAAMPRDVIRAWWDRAPPTDTGNDHCPWTLQREHLGLVAQGPYRIHAGNARGAPLSNALVNFAAVLDAVAERRVAERQASRGQTLRQQLAELPQAVQAERATYEARRLQIEARLQSGPLAQPEPRRFADVRPDRHGWRWWHLFGSDCGARGTLIEVSPVHGWRVKDDPDADWHLRGHYNSAVDGIRTVIPTDEQGNPVSWESIGPTDPTEIRLTSAPGAPDRHGTRGAAPEGPPPRPGQFSNDLTASAPITAESFARVLQQMDRSAMVAATRFAETPQTRALVEAQRAREEAETRARVLQQVRNGVEQELSDNRVIIGVDTLKQQPLPRFTADELDDVDHSKTTKLDEIALRRGKLPTVEQIAKYREVRARRAGGAVADALKESRIDCEVAQYVLEQWAGGLGDAQVPWLIATAEGTGRLPDSYARSVIDERVQNELRKRGALDTSEKPSPTVQRERQEAEERRQRLAELRQRLAAERAAQPQEMAKESEAFRFDLIEPDPQADPAASIRAWEARQAAAKVRPVAVPAKPAAVPRRPAIEVVDAEVDGLSRSEAFAALFGRALNGGC